jgi:putative peptidoglycan lipid II flippase
VGGIGLNAVFDWLLVGGPTPAGLQLPALNFGAPGLVLATVAVNLITCLGLLTGLSSRLGGLPLRIWARDTLALVGAALASGLAAWFLARGVGWPGGLPGLLLQNGVCAGLSLALFGLLASLAGVPEARQLLQLVRRRRS